MAADKEEVIARAKAERRRFKRVDTEFAGRFFVPSENREALCTISDMSPGGARIASELLPEPGTPVVVYIDSFGRFEGTITRHVDGNFGVGFVCSAHKRERVAEQLTLFLNGMKPDDAALRRHDRTPTKGMARFTRANGDVVKCEVLDLSLSGVSLITDIRPPVGEIVLIGQMAGRIARHHETGVGIEFIVHGEAVMEPPRSKLFAAK